MAFHGCLHIHLHDQGPIGVICPVQHGEGESTPAAADLPDDLLHDQLPPRRTLLWSRLTSRGLGGCDLEAWEGEFVFPPLLDMSAGHRLTRL